jgi:hypothetical protein
MRWLKGGGRMRLEGELLSKVVQAVERIPFGAVTVRVFAGEISSIETQETRKIVKRGKLPISES